MNPKAAERQWQVVDGQQHLGIFAESRLAAQVACGQVPASVLLSCGSGWLTLPQFMAQFGTVAQHANGDFQPLVPPPLPRARRAPVAQPDQSGIPVLDLPEPGDPAPVIPLAMPAFAPPPGPVAPPGYDAHAGFTYPVAFDPGTAPQAPPMPIDEDGPPERDRIVVLGRRQSGKTIYLASLYAKLWRSLDGLTAKALRGDVHKQLMEVNQVLREGRWPAATLESRQMELELEEGGKKRLMVALDYAGELFANAFVHERLDMPEVKSLVNHIDRAAAVMLLIDPSIVAGMDHQAAMEDDFGLVQAVNRIRNWPGGDDVPIVLVLTKVDQYQSLLDRFGGPDGFVRHHFPALVRLLKKIAIFQVSAVQVEKGPGGKPVPRKDSAAINVENPLRYCIRKIHKAEEKTELERSARERSAMESRLRLQEQRRESRQNFLIAAAIILIVAVGFAIIALVVLKG